MLLAIAVFSVVVLLLLATSTVKVFSNILSSREEDYDDEDEYIYEDQPLQHPTNYTDYR